MAINKGQYQNYYNSVNTEKKIEKPIDILKRLRNSNNVKKTGFLKETSQDISQTFGSLGETSKKTISKLGDIYDAKKSGKQKLARSVFQTTGTLAGGISGAIGDVTMGIGKTLLPQSVEKSVKTGLTSGISALMNVDKSIGSPVANLIERYNSLDEVSKRDIDAALGIGSLALDLSGMGLAGKGTKVGSKIVREATETGLKKTAQTLKPLTTKVQTIVKPTEKQAVEKASQEIYNVLGNYSKTRKALNYSKDAQASNIKRIAESGFLNDSIKDGKIFTKQSGGAVEQYRKATLDGTEGIVRKGLETLDESVDPKRLEDYLISQIEGNTRLVGREKTKAIRNVKEEVLSYRRNAKGEIPLTELQDAKTATYNIIGDFATPASTKTYQKELGNSLKKFIEDNTNFSVTVGGKKYGIKDINKEIAKYLEDIKILESLDGRVVRGGKLGAYFSQITGNIAGGFAGNLIGGPAGGAVGAVVGGEVAGTLKKSALGRTFGKVKGTVKESPLLKKAKQQVLK